MICIFVILSVGIVIASIMILISVYGCVVMMMIRILIMMEMLLIYRRVCGRKGGIYAK